MSLRDNYVPGEEVLADDINAIVSLELQTMNNVLENLIQQYYDGNVLNDYDVFFDGFSDETKISNTGNGTIATGGASSGQARINLETAGQANSFEVGDPVVIHSSTDYELKRVTAISADTIYADPLTSGDGWAFTESSTPFNDQGVVSSKRRLQLVTPSSSGDYGQIEKTLTLPNGLTTFKVTIREIRTGNDFGSTLKLLVDGVEVDSEAGINNTDVVLQGSATVAGGDAVVTIRIVAQTLGSGVTNNYDISLLTIGDNYIDVHSNLTNSYVAGDKVEVSNISVDDPNKKLILDVDTGSANIDLLVVGGGGGGGGNDGAGGGAGDYVYETGFAIDINGSYAIQVGTGGVGGTNNAGSNGTSSKFDTGGALEVEAIGGGGGAGGGTANGSNGGSGGGSRGGGTPGTGTGVNGNDGGNSSGTGTGGGGGAGAVGANGSGSTGGNGGNGLSNSITGSSVTYAGGGGGSGDSVAGTGGTGGGGNATIEGGGVGGNGTDGLGGGGGGASTGGVAGGSGGDGVVIIRYLTADFTATGGTITFDGDYTIHTFTSSGTFDATANNASTGYYHSIRQVFQEVKKSLRLWVTRNFSTRANLYASIAVSDDTLEIETDVSDRYAVGNIIDIYDAQNLKRERKTLTAVTPPTLGASGGTITFDGQYVIHTFSFDDDFVVNSEIDVEYLLVGGGGGGARNPDDVNSSGGGGGGEVVPGTDNNLGAGTYPVVVGLGGAGATNGAGTDGTDSTWNGHTADGGQGGQTTGGGASGSGQAGGTNGTAGGGGGGDSAVGANGSGAASGNGGAGGAGTSNSITGSAVFYGGGGGGGAFNAGGGSGGAGGNGGGGNGGTSGGSNGVDGLGGGGGGSGATGPAFDGGDGVVILRYLNPTPLATELEFTPAVINASGFGTTAFVERVDTIPQASLVANGGNIDFQDMTYRRSVLDEANDEVQDEYSYEVGTGVNDLTVRLFLSRELISLPVYARRLKVATAK